VITEKSQRHGEGSGFVFTFNLCTLRLKVRWTQRCLACLHMEAGARSNLRTPGFTAF
jgi:hypothetical protein